MNNKEFEFEYERLNKEQKEAVNWIEGPVMVVAGPGTGKTQILAMRIANILKKTQADPSNILCLTFTNSGVQAMKERLLKIIGPASYQIHVHTFHSFCNEVINTFPEKFLTARQINQLSDLEQIQLIQKILTKNSYKEIKPLKSPFYYQNAIRSSISALKQENISPERFQELALEEEKRFENTEDLYHDKGANKGKLKGKHEKEKTNIAKNLELADVYKNYQDELINTGKYDFSDMILYAVNAFSNDSEVLSYYQEKYQYILVDEFQDTNSAQNKVISLLASSYYENPNLFVVGDDEQSIYRFQGASLENILEFKKSYPLAKIIVLEKNYRSIQKILDASRYVIQNNKNQIFSLLNIDKKLLSQNKLEDGNVMIGEFSTGEVESFFVAKKIEELVKKECVSPNDIAILYKEHRDAELLIDFLSKLNLPYVIEIGGNILEDPEINKAITYLKALNFGVKDSDNQLLLEVMHYSFFGISPLDIYKVISKARELRKNLFDVIASNKILDTLELEEPTAIKEFVLNFLDCRHLANSTTFAHAFEYIINKTGYLSYLLSLNESVHHLNRLQTLFDEIKKLNTKNKNLKLIGFLEYINQMQENNLSIKQKEISPNYEGVHLMTAHKSKGLEFSYIFILRCVDKHWGNKAKREVIKLPSSILKMNKNGDSSFVVLAEREAQEEEERRLFYVALTRAKKHLFLSYAKAYGDSDNPTLTVPSKFIIEIPQGLTQKLNNKTYEEKFDERLLLSFANKKWQPSEKLEDFLRGLIKEFKLSPTALNSYLDCPQRFFYDNILRVPKTKDFNQGYGTAVHRALELLFKKYKRDFKLPPKDEFVSDFKEALKEEIFTEADKKRALEQGEEILSKYYDSNASVWQKNGVPVSCELDFGKHNVYYNDIPITGKIDRLDLIDSISNKVRIIDYKTSKPKSQNQLLGLTKDKDENYLNQAYFYKLLAETDPSFNWKIGEILFDFISPDKDQFKKVALPIDHTKYEEFKNKVEEVYDKIVNLEFHLDEQACKKGNGKCAYFNICHSESK